MEHSVFLISSWIKQSLSDWKLSRIKTYLCSVTIFNSLQNSDMLLSTEVYLFYSCYHVNGWLIGVGRNNQEVQKGIIPNKSRAEELATAQFNATKKELTASESRGSFFRRRRGSHRRSKSLSRVSKNCPS